jgi:hypothetical protein
MSDSSTEIAIEYLSWINERLREAATDRQKPARRSLRTWLQSLTPLLASLSYSYGRFITF